MGHLGHCSGSLGPASLWSLLWQPLSCSLSLSAANGQVPLHANRYGGLDEACSLVWVDRGGHAFHAPHLWLGTCVSGEILAGPSRRPVYTSNACGVVVQRT